ncbi:MAG: single-stranded DNA-binding protein [Puniceicoccales bacterium]|jgi:single-strand DNA-binding protein|nr:single-stranded DNA-binding protein [Puniceicoccales bacterium]
MASFNKVILAGNLTRDPELKSLPSGQSLAKLGLAVNRRYKTKEGEQREEVIFIDIDCFGVQAETIAKYCTKGSGLLIEGRLKLDQWDDKNTGEKKSRLGVVLEGFTFLGSRGDNASGGGSQGNYDAVPARRPASGATASVQRSAPPPPPSDNLSDEDVPF